MGALVGFWPADHDPYGIVRGYLSAIESGYLIFSYACDEKLSAKVRGQALALYMRMVAPIYPLSPAEILKFFDGLDLLEPGLVEASKWRTDYAVPPDVGDAQFLAAVAEFRSGGPGS